MKSKDKLLNLLKNEEFVISQNILMKISVREIAIACLHLNEDERLIVFSYLPVKKIERVNDEIRFNKKLDISYALYAKIIDKIIEYFDPAKKDPEHNSYIRPKRF